MSTTTCNVFERPELENFTAPALKALATLYSALQRMNRALVTADARQIFECAHAISDCLPPLSNDTDTGGFDVNHFSETEARQARYLARRIMDIQAANAALTEGGLRTVRSFVQALGLDQPYDEGGRLNTMVTSGDVNISA